MKTGKIYFEKVVQDSQEYGSNDEHMVSRVFFCLEIDGVKHNGLFANIKQTVGSDYESGPLEVSRPENYRGDFNFGAFREFAEQYYRATIGRNARFISLGPGTSARMRNNTISFGVEAEIQVTDAAGSW